MAAPLAAVQPAWAAERRFPVQIRIPVVIAINTGLPRDLVITGPDHELPELLLRWLQSDPRYRGWFTAKSAPVDGIEKTAIEAQPGETVTLAEDEPDTNDADSQNRTPASRRRKKSDD